MDPCSATGSSARTRVASTSEAVKNLSSSGIHCGMCLFLSVEIGKRRRRVVDLVVQFSIMNREILFK